MSGKTAVVTGGANGIGLGIARRLRSDGFNVVLWDRAADRFGELEAEFGPLSTVNVDVTDEASVAAAFDTTLAASGRIDVLVNNAGIQVKTTPIWEYDLATWQRVLNVNLTGTFLCTRAVSAHMRDRQSGRIVNIASVSAKHGSFQLCAYASSKAAVVALTKSVAKELAPFGVLVNAVSPTMVDTELMRSAGQEHVERGKKIIPLGRLGKIEEVSALVSWLSSEECSFSTGAVFDISGGVSTY